MSREYYELLGLPRKLTLTPEELQVRFYHLSRRWHPDLFVRKPEVEKQLALDTSSALNDAYRTLRNPIERAEYFLKLEGFDGGELGSNHVPPELLEEVFEWNMAKEELRGGDASAQTQLEAMARNFGEMLAGIDRELQTLFANYDAAPGREVLAKIRALLNRRKYIQNLVG